jgi:putative ABC transport system permease protein
MSFAVTQRTREMGVRSAHGARRGQLVALLMRRSIVHLAIGVVLRLALAVVASGALRPLLYRVDPRDIWVFAGVVLMLITVSLLASLLPARRVAKIDPVRALTSE